MKEFLQGNIAAMKSAIENGLDFYAGYPITPSTESLEYAAEHMTSKQYINSFSELETINLLYGAGSTGRRCMTATSGCGLSLMREGLSYAVGAMVPMVIYNVMRFGPGLGGITPSNEDISIVWGVGHGQSKVPVLTPSTVQEIADAMKAAFDIADVLRMPVLVMVDATLGQMYEPVEITKSNLKINKDWAVGMHKNNVITSRRIIQSYKMGDDEQDKQIKFIGNREKTMYNHCVQMMKNTMKMSYSETGKYILGIGTTGRAVREVAEKKGIGYIVPLLLNPFSFPFREAIRDLTVVEVGGSQLFDIMKYHFPDTNVRSMVFSHAIPDSDDIIDRMYPSNNGGD
jgi:pyruvate/2-oxoacid:ferredoxin oxidoreductase alpha subunit